MRTHPASNSGFTLLELMLVITVAAVIMGIAVPNLRQFIWNSRMTSAANDMMISITAARSEAIKSRSQTLVCFSASPQATTPACDGNGTQGWIVFVDANSDGAPNAGEVITLRHDALPATISLRTNPGTNAGYVAFNASGFSRTLGIGVPLTGMVLCDQRGNVALHAADTSTGRSIRIETTGRARVSRLISDITSLGGCP